jgi:Cytochrome c peroxidase
MSCATCHDPAYAYGPPNDLAVQPGGPTLSDRGTRAVPSLRYSEYTPPYSDLLDNPDGISKPGPGGGLTLDGRAPTLADQARIPLLAANEMANRDAADVVAKIKASSYAHEFEDAFGRGYSRTRPARFAARWMRSRRFSSKMTASIPTPASTIGMRATRSAVTSPRRSGGGLPSTTIPGKATASPVITTERD